MHLRTTEIRSVGLGELVLQLKAHGFTFTLRVFSGGGYVPSTAVWKLGRVVVALSEAGEA